VRVRIHRGAHQIGGSCVEVEASDSRLVLDVGRPLDAARDDQVPLPEVAGLSSDDASLLGVIITHAHQDHWGLVGQVSSGVALYMGEATARILAEAAFWTTGLTIPPTGYLAHRATFQLGPFRITPFLNDHSAFDAYSLLVEADGRQLFYTGDICGHGRKHAIFAELLRKPPMGIDVLLMEGTNVRPAGGDALDQPTETDIEAACTEIFRAAEGMALVTWSAQNIDRLVTIYRAALRSGRDLVVDLYTASIARETGNLNIPQPGNEWPHVRVYMPVWQRVKVKESGQFDRVKDIKPFRLFEEQLAAEPSRYVTQFGFASANSFERAGCLKSANAVWSLWPGYLKDGSGKRLTEFYDRVGVPWSIQHTSGHASVPELKRLAHALRADRIVPIHSLGGARFPDYFDNVTPEPDGAWWEV
jgi:ribonuclease J